MAKIIKLTPEHIEQLKKDFEATLTDSVSDGKVSFTKAFDNIKRDATVFFTELAWLKMQTLVREFDKEVAWHGVVMRGTDETKDEYYISDILVYPQEVTGATVNTDQEKYQMWLMSHDDDVFNNIRMQGHSHVNMGVTPSGVDNTLYEKILAQLEDDMFYIFMIWNKRGEKTIKIYDLAKNIFFDTSDCTVKILDDGTGVEQFLKNAKAMVANKVTAPMVSQNSYSYTGYSGYGSGYTNYYGNNSKSSASQKTTTSQKSEKKADPSTFTRKGRRRKGKQV